MFTIEGAGLSLQDKRSLLDWTLRPALRALPGVADVNVLGGQAKSFVVVPDRARLLANGLHFSDLVQVLERNRNDGAGRINAGENAVVVRVEGAQQWMTSAINVVVKAGMPPLRIKDLATVHIDAMTRYGAVTRDGQHEAVQGSWWPCVVPMPRNWCMPPSPNCRVCSPACRRASRWCRFTTAAV